MSASPSPPQPEVPAPEAFWKLLATSRLVDPATLAGLQQQESGTTTQIARQLVARGVISQWQARRLLRNEAGPFFLGDYRLVDRLPCDGRGRLYRARHEPSARVVRLMHLSKSLCRQLDVWTEIVRRTTIAHQAADPVLGRTWALEQVGPERFIVCEDIPGEPLADELGRLGPLAVREAGTLVLALTGAVAELHRKGSVHGAISLDSVVREPVAAGIEGRSGRVRLLQFPLAGDPHLVPLRVMSEQPEEVERLGRRASFVAPELMLPGRSCDARSDVYALGCVFHSLLTGKPPCWQGTPQRTLTESAFVGPPALGPPAVPIEVATLVSYMAARDPAARYPTAVDAARAIAACLGLPVPAAAAVSAAADAPAVPAASTAGAALPAGGQPAHAFPLSAPAIASASTRDAAIQAATLAARRRAARLRTIGLAACGGLVALAAAALVIPTLVGPESTAAGKASPQASRQSAAPAPRDSDSDDAAAGDGETAARLTTTRDVEAATTMARETPDDAAAAAPTVVDDPALPWASPTSGDPPSLEYLPPDSRLILLARPAEISGDDEGKLFLRSLGPGVQAAVTALESLCGLGLDGIETLQAGWHAAGGPDEIAGCYALRLVEPLPPPSDVPGASIGDETIYPGRPLARWMPAAEAGRVLVLAPEATLREMAGGNGAGPSLPQDLETLVGMLDRDRHLTLFGSPAYLLHDGRGALSGPLAKLVEPLASFLGPTPRAAALSLHFGENFYVEMDAVGTVDMPAPRLAAGFAERIGALADAVEEYCVALDPHPYGRKLVLRLPAMIRLLAANTRAGAEGKGVVVNGYLPRHAAHNLVLAAELALAQTPGRQPPAAAAAPAAGGALDRLQKRISLSFARDTLEKSIQMIADEVGVPMDILGGDLQLEGITKNQSFGLDERDKTADAILRTILAKSNPDGKLVYVVHVRDGVEAIDITTRAAAAKRGDKLPPGF